MYWIAYVTLGLAVGLVVGYVKGAKDGQEDGYNTGWEHHEEVLRGLHSQRGQKAAATRRAKKATP